MSSNPRTIFHCISLFALLALLTPTLNAQAPNQASPQNLTCSPAPCVFQDVPVSQGGYPRRSNAITANPNDPSRLVVAAEDSNCTKSDLGFFSSLDAGITWTHSCFPLQPDAVWGLGNVFLAYDSAGVLYGGNVEQRNPGASPVRMLLRASKDDGATWDSQVTVLETKTGGIGFPQIAIDTSHGSPFQNAIYISSNTGSITVSNSHDGARTWNSVRIDRSEGAISEGSGEIAIGRDGTVYLTWIRCKSRGEFGCGSTVADVLISKSKDGGNTWSAPVEVAQPRLAPDPGAETTWGVLPGTVDVPVSNIPVVAIDNSTGPYAGNLYVAFYNYNGSYMQVGVVTSRDGGSTWSAPVSVSKSNIGDQFFHWMSVASDGKIGVTWLDTRRHVRVNYQPFYAVSTDGGATFTGDQALSANLSDPLKSYFIHFLGDFRTHTWADNALYATWMDNSVGNLQVRLGGVQF